jgi:hypothetical protein
MCLELGIIPVRYVMMEKRIKYLNVILNEDTSSTLRQVYDTLKCDSRKGDFYNLVQKDLKDLDIKLNDKEIQDYSKLKWKTHISQIIKKSAFQYLLQENSELEKTKHIIFDELKLSNYLLDNRNTTLSKIIFSVRSQTFDIKAWQPWKYFDNLCVLCHIKEENMNHFMICDACENVAPEKNWTNIFENKPDEQFRIAKLVKQRLRIRNKKIDNYEAGQTQDSPDSRAPGDCRAV